MTQQTKIKTLNGGSIDYAHYISKSHEIRSKDAHRSLAAILQLFRAAWTATKSLNFFRRSNKAKFAEVPVLENRSA